MLAAVAAIPFTVSLVGLDGAGLATQLVQAAPPDDAPHPTLWLWSAPVRQPPPPASHTGGHDTSIAAAAAANPRHAPPKVMLVEVAAALRGSAWGAFGEANEAAGATELLAAALLACSIIVQAVSAWRAPQSAFQSPFKKSIKKSHLLARCMPSFSVTCLVPQPSRAMHLFPFTPIGTPYFSSGG